MVDKNRISLLGLHFTGKDECLGNGPHELFTYGAMIYCRVCWWGQRGRDTGGILWKCDEMPDLYSGGLLIFLVYAIIRLRLGIILEPEGAE